MNSYSMKNAFLSHHRNSRAPSRVNPSFPGHPTVVSLLTHLVFLAFSALQTFHTNRCSRSITDSPSNSCNGSPGSTNGTSSSETPPTSTNNTGQILPGTAANCTNFYVVQAGDTCNIVDARNNITLDTLKQLNTEISPACDNLVIGQGLCVKI